MTTLVPLDKWVDTIVGRLNGAVPEMVRTEVTNTVREFFVESSVWQIEFRMGVQAATSTYDLSSAIPEGEVTFIQKAHFKERLLTPAAEFPFAWDEEGDPHYYWSPEPGLMRLAPIPQIDEDQVMRVRVALQPSGCEVPDWIERLFFRAIATGTLGRMYGHPKRPYTNPQLAAQHSQNFRSSIARARSMANRRFTTAEHTFRFPRGWSPVI